MTTTGASLEPQRRDNMRKLAIKCRFKKQLHLSATQTSNVVLDSRAGVYRQEVVDRLGGELQGVCNC